MSRWITAAAAALILGAGLATPADAQTRRNSEKGLSRVGGALTERQARAECRMQMSGTRTSRTAMNRQMRDCIRDKTMGNNQ
ncbi:MAG: hypothetical protein HEQ16_15490 [Bosea sp.]|jgi:hypothetical protein|nr:hypothetical protein [Bosea sp. (in: a-proteobacteria)]